MKALSQLKRLRAAIFTAFAVFFVFSGCSREQIDSIIMNTEPKKEVPEEFGGANYYDKFFNQLSNRSHIATGTSNIMALDALPKDPQGLVDWTGAVVKGYINPKGSLDPMVVDEPPLNLNIFIEAKVPLMANVLFPHSIHTYWLSCNNCHPKIFIPEAGANPISMDEIFKGEWCGRCHGKVAFTFWPRSNCTRCHIILKGQSLEKERWK